MKAKRKQPRKLAECDELFLIQEMAKMIKSSRADKARKIVALVKICSIKNASDVILGGLVGCTKQYINEIRRDRTYKKKEKKKNMKLTSKQENVLVEWIRNRYIKYKKPVTPKELREEIYKRYKIIVSGNFHAYFVGRHKKKLGIKEDTAR
jgi:transposase